MKKYLIIAIAAISLTFSSCEQEDVNDFDSPNYVGLEANPRTLGVPVSGSVSQEISVYAANSVDFDRTFDLVVYSTGSRPISPDAYSVPGTVTVPANSTEATFSVEVSDIGLGLGGKQLILGLANGDNDSYTLGRSTFNVSRVCPGEEFKIDLTLDAYPSETGFEILDVDGNSLIRVNGNPGASRSLCLPSGTYTFFLRDSYGDGITDGGATLSYAGTVLATIPGDFGSETSVEVTF